VGYAFIVTALVLTGLMVYIHVQLLKVDPGKYQYTCTIMCLHIVTVTEDILEGIRAEAL